MKKMPLALFIGGRKSHLSGTIFLSVIPLFPGSDSKVKGYFLIIQIKCKLFLNKSSYYANFYPILNIFLKVVMGE